MLKRAIDSVLQQTYSDFELIVVNDGSTDQTENLLESYGQKIRVINQINQERSAARNNGIRMAQGEYIAFLDDDDWWLPDKLSRQLQLLNEYPECVLCCCYADQITQNQTFLQRMEMDFPIHSKPFDAFSWFYLGNSVPTLTAIVTRRILDKSGLFNTQLSTVEDWDLWMRVALHGQIICYPKSLACIQLHHRYLPDMFDHYNQQDARLVVLNNMKRLLTELGFLERIDPGLMRLGEARAFWYGALIDFAVNKIDSAKERALKSFATDASFFEQRISGNAFEMLIGFSVSLNEEFTQPMDAEKFIGHVYHNLPDLLKTRLKSYQLTGAMSAWYGHHAYQNSNYMAASRFMGRAILSDPALIINKGNLAVLVKSIIKN
jgi:glycosyltransferase involved in cell wall biosynthesis